MMFKVQHENNDSGTSRPDDAIMFKFAEPKMQSMSVSSGEVSFVLGGLGCGWFPLWVEAKSSWVV